LKQPSIAYCAVLLLAVSIVLCAGWGTRVLLEGAKLASFAHLFYAFAIVGILIAFLPLMPFVPALLAARLRGQIAYGDLVTDYSRRFQARWTEGRSRDDLLGNSDMQSLADISTSYRENVEKMQVLLFDVRDCLRLLVVAAVPAVPFLLTQQSSREAVMRLLRLVTGLPG